MKVFLPIGSFYPAQIGGPDNIMYWHAKALQQRGHTVWVATTNDGIAADVPLDRWLKTDYGKVIYVKTAIHYAPLKLLLASIGPLLRCDVIHLSAIFYPISWLLAPLAIILGKKVVWTVHGELDPDVLIYSTGRKKVVLSVVRLLKNRVVFHSTCDAETKYIRLQFGSSVAVLQLPYFVELAPQQTQQPDDYWLYVGRIHPKKAIENLIEALPQVRSKKRLKIIGDHHNEYGRQLIELAERLGCREQIDFLGHKRGEDKYQLMANAYCLVMPSHTENFGIVVTEALTQGTPAIASFGTPWQVLNDRQAGFWSSNNVAALARTLDQMAELDNETYRQYRTNARNLVEDYDVTKNIHQWEGIYESLRARHARKADTFYEGIPGHTSYS